MSNARSRKDKCRKVFCIPELVAKKNQMQQRPLLLSLCSLAIMGWKTVMSVLYIIYTIYRIVISVIIYTILFMY